MLTMGKVLHGVRVLIVDDEPLLRTAFRRTVTQAGGSVVAVAGVRDAIDALAHQRFDVVVTDLLMPELTGADLLAHLRVHRPGLPVVLMCGMTEHGVVADATLAKPSSTDELVRTLARVVGAGVDRPLARCD